MIGWEGLPLGSGLEGSWELHLTAQARAHPEPRHASRPAPMALYGPRQGWAHIPRNQAGPPTKC